jgi:hypothetical protein
MTHPLTAQALGLPSPKLVSAAFPLLAAGLLMWKRRLPRLVALLGVLTGTTLTAGWIYKGIHGLVGGATWGVNLLTLHTFGGVVPGFVAVCVLIYFGLEMAPARLVTHLRGVRDPRQLVTAMRGSGRLGGRGELAGRPEKIGALAAGIVLPSIAATIPGMIGVAALSMINVVSGLLGWVVGFLVGGA